MGNKRRSQRLLQASSSNREATMDSQLDASSSDAVYSAAISSSPSHSSVESLVHKAPSSVRATVDPESSDSEDIELEDHFDEAPSMLFEEMDLDSPNPFPLTMARPPPARRHSLEHIAPVARQRKPHSSAPSSPILSPSTAKSANFEATWQPLDSQRLWIPRSQRPPTRRHSLEHIAPVASQKKSLSSAPSSPILSPSTAKPANFDEVWQPLELDFTLVNAQIVNPFVVQQVPLLDQQSYKDGKEHYGLVKINGHFPAGYSAQSISSGGRSNTLGQRDVVKISKPAVGHSAIYIESNLHSQYMITKMSTIKITLKHEQVDIVRRANIPAAEDDTDETTETEPANYLQYESRLFTELGTRGRQTTEVVSEHIRMAVFDIIVNAQDVIVYDGERTSPVFSSTDDGKFVLDCYVERLNTVRDATDGQTVTFTVIFPLKSPSVSEFDKLVEFSQCLDQQPLPMELDDMVKTKFKNFSLAGLQRQSDAYPALRVFDNPANYCQTYMYALKDQLLFNEKAIELMGEALVECVLIPIASSAWNLQPNAEQEYGVRPDDRPEEFLICMKASPLLAQVMAEVESKGKLSLPGVEFTGCHLDLPDNSPNRNMLCLDLAHKAFLASDKADHARDAAEAKAAKEEEQDPDASDNEMDVPRVPNHSDPTWLQAFVDSMHKDIMRILTPERVRDLAARHAEETGEPAGAMSDESRAVHYIADRFMPLEDDTEDILAVRVAELMDELSVTTLAPPVELVGSFKVARIQVPGAPSRNLLFRARISRQLNWPHGLKAPALRVVHPTVELSGNLVKRLDGMFGTALVEKSDSALERPIEATDKNVCVGVLTPEFDDTTIVRGARALRDCAGGTDSAAARFEHIATLQPCEARHRRNLLEVYPGMARLFETTTNQNVLDVLKSMLDTNAGLVSVIGGPGSGKTSTMVQIAEAALSDESRLHLGYPAPLQEAIRRTVVLMTLPSHTLANDAMSRFPCRRVVRIFSKDSMLSFVLNLHKIPALPLGMSNTTPAMRKAIMHLNNIRQLADEDARGIGGERSLVQLALVHGEGTDELAIIQDVQQRIGARELNNIGTDIKDAKTAFKTLCLHVLESAEVCIGTPVAASDLGWFGDDFMPTLIIQDEAGRLTEPDMMMAMMHYRVIPTILIGDSRQFGPIVPTSRKKLGSSSSKEVVWSDALGPQLGTSFLKRVLDLNKYSVMLEDNFRAIGKTADWAAKSLYGGKLRTVHKDNTNAVKSLIKYYGKQTQGASFANLFIDLDPEAAPSEPHGTSWINPVTAEFVVDLAVELSRQNICRLTDVDKPKADRRRCQVLILTGYAPQKHEIDKVLERLSPGLVNPALVEARTIDDAPSHQADIVIVEHTRQDAVGFQADPERLSVSQTRAHYSTINVGCTKGMSRSNLMDSLIKFQKDVTGMTFLRKRDLKHCDVCKEWGHGPRDCKTRVTCYLCPGFTDNKHPAAKCKRATVCTANEFLSQENPVADSTNRNVLTLCKVKSSDNAAASSIMRAEPAWCNEATRVPSAAASAFASVSASVPVLRLVPVGQAATETVDQPMPDASTEDDGWNSYGGNNEANDSAGWNMGGDTTEAGDESSGGW